MRIIIIGGGVVGFSLAEQLRYENHDVSLVEKDSKICQDVRDRIDVRIICGNGSSPSVLVEAGLKGADMVLAVTPVDELNIVVCEIARQHEVPARIARIRSREFRGADSSVDLEKMGVTLVISPESVLVDSIIHYVETPGATDANNFQNGNVLMRGYHVTSEMSLVNRFLREIRQENKEHPLLFVAAIRQNKGIIPDGDYIVEPDDDLFGIFPRSSIDAYLNLFNKTRQGIDNVIISGDTLTAILLADALKNIVEKVVLVDPDMNHAEYAADVLNDVEVVHGDCTESSILNEVYVRNADFFIAVAEETEYNIMSTLLAKAEGASEVITVISEMRHDKLFSSIGIDHVIHPRLAIAREILEAVNRGQIGRVVRIRNLDIEALRIVADEESPIIGKPLQHIWKKIQKGSIIGAVLRGDDMIIPDGDTIIEPGDQMIVITYSKNIARVKKLFKSRYL